MSDALLVLTVMESLLDHVLEVLAWLECWDLGLRDDDSCVCCDVSCCLLCPGLHGECAEATEIDVFTLGE